MATLKDWPADALMIIAARAGTENRSQMESVVHVHCRDCGTLVAADSKSIRRCSSLPCRHGRPVMFFCIECAVQHDRSQINIMLDDRPGRPAERDPRAFGGGEGTNR